MLRQLLLALCLTLPAQAEPSPLAQAEAALHKLSGEHDTATRFQIADEAVALLEKEIADHPKAKATKPHLLLSAALTVADLSHPEACRPGRCERAVEELKKARALDAGGVEAERIASELGIVHSRLGNFPEALAEYDRALLLVDSERRSVALDDGGKAVLYGNSAETLMAMGRLNEAIERYRLAEAAASAGDLEWQLAQWGLGVALDRDEQVEKSRLAIARVLEYDPSMARLSDEGVFFEPAGDKRYYEALGHEVAGDRNEAMTRWQEFLTTQPTGRWARRARAHLEALKKNTDVRPSQPAEVELGLPTGSHPLRNPAQMVRTLRDHEHEIRTCYARSLQSGKREHGEIRLSLEITSPGWVARVRTLHSTVADSALIRCVEQTIQYWRFARVEGQEIESVLLPIRFGKQP